MELSLCDGAAPCDPLTHCSPADVAPASRESRMRPRENHDVRGLGAVLPSLGDRSRPRAAVELLGKLSFNAKITGRKKRSFFRSG